MLDIKEIVKRETKKRLLRPTEEPFSLHKKTTLPEWVELLHDQLIQNNPKFGTQLLELEVKNWEKVKKSFFIYLMDSNINIVQSLHITDDLKQEVLLAIKQVRDLHKTNIVTESAAGIAAESAWGAAESAWSADWSAARSADWSAESAARSAAWSAWSAARSAWRAAESAKSATESAARSAAESAKSATESAARSAARGAAENKYAEKFLDICKENT